MLLINSRAVLGLIILSTVFVRAESFTFGTAAGLAGNSPVLGMSGDGSNNLARFTSPAGLCLDSANAIYITDGHLVRRMTVLGTNWVVTTLAGLPGNSGSADGTNGSARFNGPIGLTVDNATNLYVADFNNHTIRKAVLIGTNCVVSTIAGYAGASGSANGTNSSARFYFPQALCEDSFGN